MYTPLILTIDVSTQQRKQAEMDMYCLRIVRRRVVAGELGGAMTKIGIHPSIHPSAALLLFAY
jgi:hypothetical protein